MMWRNALCIYGMNTIRIHKHYASWFRRDTTTYNYDNVVEGLKKMYTNTLLPLEETYKFHEFHSPMLYDSDFEAKPLVLLMGQYSTGKTTLIKHLIERDFPGMCIGPKPTTDRFIAIAYGEKEGVIPGNVLVVDRRRQFRQLAKFGNTFLNRFQLSSVKSEVLNSISFIDTPGILSGEQQRINRGYDFTGVLEWFSERVDRIILLFDAHKLDICDELRRCIDVLRPHDDKIRIVLNKADLVDHQELIRVYGALMWSLGKILDTPETARVYVGSFWDRALKYDVNKRLFQDEEQDLLRDIRSLPRSSALRKLTDLSNRARLAKVHAYIISSLSQKMPMWLNRNAAKHRLIDCLPTIYKEIELEYNISAGDFPDIHKMQELLQKQDFSKFTSLKPSLINRVDWMLANDIAKLMALTQQEEQSRPENSNIQGRAFQGTMDASSSFGYRMSEGINEGVGDVDWIVSRFRYKYDSIFSKLNPVNGKVRRTDAKNEMLKSKLSYSVLGKIWMLSDVDKDGLLDSDEFALAMHLITIKLKGHALPQELPEHLVPPSKRSQSQDELSPTTSIRK